MSEDKALSPARFEKHLITPPQILGCERTPFLVLCATVAFLVITVFGIDVFSILGGTLIFIGGLRWLRAIFEQDPRYFAMRWCALAYPRHLPNSHPPAWVKDCAFMGYDDPPTPDAVAKAWCQVALVLLVPVSLVALFAGLVPAALTFAGLLLVVALWAFTG